MPNDAASISFASPQKLRARPPGADTGGDGGFCSPSFQSDMNPRSQNLRGSFADAYAIARRKVR